MIFRLIGLLFLFRVGHSGVLNFEPNATFLINTNSCQVFNYPVWDAKTSDILVKAKDYRPVSCEQVPMSDVHRQGFIFVNLDSEDPPCYAKDVQFSPGWNGPDGYKLRTVKGELNSTHHFKPYGPYRFDMVKVTCGEDEKVIPLIQHYKPKQANNSHLPNVLVLGIDSLSRLNFLRLLPKTKKLLDREDFIPMYGHHKVAENSFVNVFPMWTGAHPEELNIRTETKFDSIPLIFKDFESQGYLTTFIEDMPTYGFFSYFKSGFNKQPTNYYLRPMNLLVEKEVPWMHTCYVGKPECEIYFDYIIDQLRAFRARGKQKHFIFMQNSKLTHSGAHLAALMDVPFERFLSQIFDSNFNNDSVIILYADHATRYGPITETVSGIYEQRLAFFYLYIPDSLILSGKNASVLRQIARDNQFRLTSHFDVYATLQHVLTGHTGSGGQYGQSLLAPVPLGRTCAQAGIQPQYCLCDRYEPVVIEAKHVQVAHFLIDYLNQQIKPYRNQCHWFKFHSVLNVLEPAVVHKQYRIVILFQAAPSKPKFEAMVEVNGDFEQFQLIGSIVRINAYDKDGECVANKPLEPYCICYYPQKLPWYYFWRIN